MCPFAGSQRKDKNKDAFNFYLSQLRIRIEMAFGLLTNKWLILRRNLTTSLAMSGVVLVACARLHNYVIDEDGMDSDDSETLCAIAPMTNAPFGWGFLPVDEKLAVIPGSSQIRDIVVRHITRHQYRRHAQNIAHRRQELHEHGLM